MATSKKETEQSFAEYHQQKETLKQVVQEHTNTSEFRDYQRNSIKEYFETTDGRTNLHKHFEEYLSTDKFQEKFSMHLEDIKKKKLAESVYKIRDSLKNAIYSVPLIVVTVLITCYLPSIIEKWNSQLKTPENIATAANEAPQIPPKS